MGTYVNRPLRHRLPHGRHVPPQPRAKRLADALGSLHALEAPTCQKTMFAAPSFRPLPPLKEQLKSKLRDRGAARICETHSSAASPYNVN